MEQINENIDYEDFNGMEDMQYMNYNIYPENSSNLSNTNLNNNNSNLSNNINFKKRNENEDPNANVMTESITNSLSDRFQVFALKNQNQSQIKNFNSSNKKVITKEFFSQQINSINNLQKSNSMKHSQLLDLDNKFGISSSQLECPDYDCYTEEFLKEEMKKYGMKPGGNKFMIKQLKEIWAFMNMSKKII